MSNPTKLRLQYPIKIDGKAVDVISLRRPTVGDMRAVSQIGDPVEQEVALFARLSGINPEDLDQMDRATDYQRLGEIYNGFFEGEGEGMAAPE